jgi:hypothetical protein
MWRETGEGDRRLYWNLARDLPPERVRMTPWAVGVQKQRESRQWVDDSGAYCLPHGVPRILFASGSAGFKFVVTPAAIISLHEASTYNTFRQIYIDGRPLPSDPQPSWFGYSIGRWEGDAPRGLRASARHGLAGVHL